MAKFSLSKVTIEPLMFLCMFVAFLTWVAFPQMILTNICLGKHNETRCAAMFSGSYKNDYDIVQEESTLWFGGFLVIATFIALLTLPLVGTLSEHFGRYKIMFLTPISQLLQAIAMVVIYFNGLKFPTWALLLPGFMPGLVGDVSGLYVLAASYMAAITSEESRTLRITLLDSVVLTAGLASTLCSGFIIEKYKYLGIFATNIVSLMLALLYLIIRVKPVPPQKCDISMQAEPENQEKMSHLDGEERKPLMKVGRDKRDYKEEIGEELKTDKSFERNDKDNKSLSCIGENNQNNIERISKTDDLPHTENGNSMGDIQGSLLQPPVAVKAEPDYEKNSRCSKLLQILKQSNPVRNIKRVHSVLKAEEEMFHGSVLFLLMFLAAVCYSGEMSVVALYLKNRPYFLSARDLGFYFAYVGAMIAILGMAIFNYLFTRLLKINDYYLLFMSFCFNTAYYILLAISNSLLMLYLIQLVKSVGSLNTCVIRSVVTKISPKTTTTASTTNSPTGLLFVALFMSETVGVLFGSLICPAVYSRVAAKHPGAVFFINAGLSAASIIITMILILTIRRKRNNDDMKERLGNIVDDGVKD